MIFIKNIKIMILNSFCRINMVWECDKNEPCVKFCESNEKYKCGIMKRDMINLENKTPKQLVELSDAVKVSDLDYGEKTRLLEEIDYKLNGKRYSKDEVLKDIEDGQADIDDLL